MLSYVSKSSPVFASFAVAILLAVPANASGLDKLAPHRAVYDLTLDEASDRSGITGMNGRIVYEMTGSKCEGYSVKFRFFTQVQTDRKSFTNDQRTTSFESGDGKQFSFVNQSYLNGQLEQELRGKAQRTDTATEVALTKPEAFNLELGPSIFMTAHVGKLIDAAENGENFVTATVFDASDNGDELVDTTAVIGKKRDEVLSVGGEDESVSKLFAGQPAWPVSVSYFSTAKSTERGEKLPVYQVSFLMQESGVSRALKLQYEDYSMKGDLKEIEFLKQVECK